MHPSGGADGPAASGSPGLVARLREVHLEMMDAVLSGDGLERVAGLAAQAAGGPVAIVIPRLATAAEDDALGRYVADRLRDRPAQVPDGVVTEVPITAGDDVVGSVLLLEGPDPVSADAVEFLHLAAVASLTEVAIEETRHEVEQNLRGSLLEELRARPDLEPAEISRRARRLGCNLEHGAVVLCAELETERPRHVVATIAGEYAGALAQHMDDRVYALLPSGPNRDAG